jgi:isopentenyldiphosphate isomerase
MLSHEETFDIYNAQMERVGTAGRSEVHTKGLWHQTFHCWIVKQTENGPLLLLQLRHPDKDTFPNLLDTSCAGHLLTGESVADGVRELQEELGLQVDFASLIPCGLYAEEDKLPGERMDREFCHVFLYPCDQPHLQYRLQAEEVTGLFFVKLDDFKQLILETSYEISAAGGILTANGELIEAERNVRLQDLVRHDSAYYELLFKGIHQIESRK